MIDELFARTTAERVSIRRWPRSVEVIVTAHGRTTKGEPWQTARHLPATRIDVAAFNHDVQLMEGR